MIDLYCERIGPGLLAEPLNAATNGFFVIAAWWCWRSARASTRRDVEVLAVTMFAIGIGSGLFHTFATPWAELLDVIPLKHSIATDIVPLIQRLVDGGGATGQPGAAAAPGGGWRR